MSSTLCAHDAVVIHNAIHQGGKPIADTREHGSLACVPTKYGSYSVTLPDGLGTCLGANPEKDSSYGRKCRGGGAVTMFNPGGSYGWESRCVVFEAATKTGLPTVTKGLNLDIPRLLPDVLAEIAAGDALGLNIGDPSRTINDAELKRKQEAGEIAKPKRVKSTGKGVEVVTLVEVSKSARSKCQVCKEVIDKGCIRYGYTTNYRGRLSAAFMHTSCAPNKPAAHELPELDGWKEMSREAKAMALEAAGATGAVASSVLGDDVELKPQVFADEDDDSDGDALYVD